MAVFPFSVQQQQKLLDSYESLYRLTSLHYLLKQMWIFFLNLHTMTKNIFLPVTKRALTSLSFIAGLRNDHEVEASKRRDFKFDYFFKTHIH